MRRLLRTLWLLAALLIAAWGALSLPPHYPALKAGDLVFQTSLSSQSLAVAMATGSKFTHMGILKTYPDGRVVVIEAAGHVQETPLAHWVARGVFRRIAVYRDVQLSDAQAKKVLTEAKPFYGWPYDIHFAFGNGAMYCSELPYLTYKAAGVVLGEVQTPAQLNMDNRYVRRLIQNRWKTNPACQQHGDNFERCYQRILAQEMVTPASIASDQKLTKIYSNYFF